MAKRATKKLQTLAGTLAAALTNEASGARSGLPRIERTLGAVRLLQTGISPVRIAAALGVSRQAVSKWLAPEAMPSLQLRILIEACFGISVGSWDLYPNRESTPSLSLTPEQRNAVLAAHAERMVARVLEQSVEQLLFAQDLGQNFPVFGLFEQPEKDPQCQS